MSFSKNIRRAIVSQPLGKATVRAARTAVGRLLRLMYPGVPSDQQITNVSYKGKKFSFQHRRTNSDRSVLEQCFGTEQYDMPNGPHGELVEKVYQRIIDAGLQPLIVDCGANIGASVVWFANRYPRAHVIAIEPAPDNFALLQRNTSGFDVDLVEAGIAATDHVAHLNDPGDGGWAYRTAERGDGPQIKMVGLETLLASKPPSRYRPFILKIDIEGAEKELFAGDTSTINSFPLIILEPHDWLFPGEYSSLDFFRFHVEAKREFCMKDENVASVMWDSSLEPR
jgi:FkbM family methyltransferase